MAPAVGFAIAAMPPLIVVELFTQPVRQQAELGGFIGRGTVLAGVAGASAGTYVWIKGLAFRDTIPDEMKEMLTSTLVLFAAHHDPAVYDRLDGQIQAFSLAVQVQAFDSDGNPAVEPQGKPRAASPGSRAGYSPASQIYR